MDQDFFARLKARVDWSADNGHIDDAYRFAVVGDYACEVTKRPTGYCFGLFSRRRYYDGNDFETGYVIDNFIFTHPQWPDAIYLRAAYRRQYGDWAGVADDYRTLIRQSFRLEDCYRYRELCLLELEKQGKIVAERFYHDQGEPRGYPVEIEIPTLPREVDPLESTLLLAG